MIEQKIEAHTAVTLMAEIDRKALVAALRRACRIASKKDTLDVLTHVLIEPSASGVRIVAADLDMQSVEQVAGVAVGKGACLRAHDLLAWARSASGNMVNIEVTDNTARLICGNLTRSAPVKSRDDFPASYTREVTALWTYSVEARDLYRDLSRLAICMSTEQTRYYLRGVYFGAANGTLHMAATDGHRLCEIRRPAVGDLGDGHIVPDAFINQVLRVVGPKDSRQATLRIGDRVQLVVGDYSLTSKLVDGAFPDYLRVIPTANDKTLRFDAEALARAVKSVASIGSDKSLPLKLSIIAESVTASVTSPEHGTASETISAVYDGSAMQIGFNSRYLLDILSQFGGSGVDIFMADPGAPVLIRANEADGVRYVLMPMRLY